MKHFLCLMGRLSPISSLYKTKLSAMLAVTTLFMCLIAAYKAPAQTGAAVNMDEIKPLQIGDTIPEELWHLPLQVVNHPEGKETITLNDYRGKLIILDFWATWCGSCIAAMPKIAEVQNELADDIVIVPVSWSEAEATKKKLSTHRDLVPLNLFSVIDAEELIGTFPHRVVPHLVWIYDDKVRSLTTSIDITPYNVRAIIANQDFQLVLKNDEERDHFIPIIKYAVDEGERELIQSAITGHIPGFGGIGTRNNEGLTVQYFYNRTPWEIYRVAYGIGFENFILEENVPLRFKQQISNSDTNGIYCYQIIAPQDMPAEARHRKIASDLNAYFGLEAVIETRDTTCFVITEADNPNTRPDVNNNGKTFTLVQFVQALNHANNLDLERPLFSIEASNDIMLPRTLDTSVLKYDIPQLEEILNRYGLAIEVAIRPRDFLVFKNVRKSPFIQK